MPRLLVMSPGIFLILMTAFTALRAAPGRDVIVLKEGRVQITPGLRMSYFEDRKGTLDLRRARGEFASRFRPVMEKRPSFGQSDSTFWFRLFLRNDAPVARLYYAQIEFPRLDEVEFHEIHPAGGRLLNRALTGDALPFSRRPIPHADFVFPFRLGPAESREIYLRVRTGGITRVPLVIRDAKSFRARSENRKLLLGAYFGIIIVMAVYNLVLFGVLRERAYIYYSFCILSFAVYQMSAGGIAYEYLWPNAPGWNARAIPFFTSLACAGAAPFSMRFLDLSRLMPRLNLICAWLTGAALFTALLSLSPYYIAASHLIRVLALFFIGVIVCAGVYLARKGHRPAVYYLIAWGGYLAGIVMFVLQLRGWLPGNLLTESGIQIGSVLEVFLLSLGLADRIQTGMQIQVRERTEELNQALGSLRERDELLRFELDMARDIQTAILPGNEAPHEGFHWTVHYEALEEVGGDFYDIAPLPGGGFALVVADASGHGVPAALMTMIAKIAFAQALRAGDSPHDILRRMRREFLDSVRSPEYYVTASLVFVLPDGRARFSNAGHVAPFILRKRDGRVDEIQVPGVFLGGVDFEAIPYETVQEHLHPGDRLFIFTDGITEARNPEDDMYGEERLREIALANQNASIEATREAVLTDWRRYIGHARRADDMTLVILEARPALD